MKILFLLLHLDENEKSSSMYTDLIEEFRDNGHDITIMAPSHNNKTYITKERGVEVLRVKSRESLGISNMIKKGIALALLPFYYKKAFNKYLSNCKFDWIFMPTPPITLIDFVDYIKNETNSKFYLILRDIHPQSAKSIGLIKYKFMYNYLAKRAKRGYEISDFIGCMSQGNIDFIANEYPELDKSKLVLLLNWQKDTGYDAPKIDIRSKFNYGNKTLILFGGNIGLGQRVENIYNLASHYSNNDNLVFLIIGKGVKKESLKELADKNNLSNIHFIDFLPREEYLDFVKSVDIGLISINENYKVPTCPSKAVSYMSLKIPIFAMINPNSDYGDIIQNSGAGYWVVGSKDEQTYISLDKMIESKILRTEMGENGYKFYLSNLTSKVAYNTIIKQIRSLCQNLV